MGAEKRRDDAFIRVIACRRRRGVKCIDCPFYLKNSCRFGVDCKYYHDPSKIASIPSTRPLCKFFTKGRCTKGAECFFRHDDDVVCPQFAQAMCNNASCKLIHKVPFGGDESTIVRIYVRNLPKETQVSSLQSIVASHGPSACVRMNPSKLQNMRKSAIIHVAFGIARHIVADLRKLGNGVVTNIQEIERSTTASASSSPFTPASASPYTASSSFSSSPPPS